MVVQGRNRRLELVRKAARAGQGYDQFAVTEVELMNQCGTAVLTASPKAKSLMQAFLRAEKARTGFSVDRNSAPYMELKGLALNRLPTDLKAPAQISTSDIGSAQTRLGRALIAALRSAGCSIGDNVSFHLNGKKGQGSLSSLDEKTGHFNIHLNLTTSLKVPAYRVIGSNGSPIISREKWNDMYSHIK